MTAVWQPMGNSGESSIKPAAMQFLWEMGHNFAYGTGTGQANHCMVGWEELRKQCVPDSSVRAWVKMHRFHQLQRIRFERLTSPILGFSEPNANRDFNAIVFTNPTTGLASATMCFFRTFATAHGAGIKNALKHLATTNLYL
jgi:hypothetical protein